MLLPRKGSVLTTRRRGHGENGQYTPCAYHIERHTTSHREKNHSTVTYSTYYTAQVTQDMMLKAHTSSPHTTPKPRMIHLHTSPGGDMNTVVASAGLMTLMSGQHPQWTRARAAMAGFKLREHQLLGCRVSLRHHAMWNFLHKLIDIVWTQHREFSGISAHSMNTQGQWSIGTRDIVLFPEIEQVWDMVPGVDGMDMNFVSSSSSHAMNMCLWSALQVPVKM